MHITYTPEDDPDARQEWTFIPKRIRQSEATIIEREYRKPYEQFVAEAQGSMQGALRILLWRLMCRDHPMLRLADAPDPYVGEVEVRHSASELKEALDNIGRAPISAEDRDAAITVLRDQLADAEAREALSGGEAEPGK